jgi:hypothetical protein
MRKLTFSLLIILFLCTLAGCKAEVVNAFKNAGELQLVVPGQSTQAIHKDSKLFNWLSSWLESHQDAWSSSPASYVPGYLVRGDDFHLNFNEGFAVLNYEDPKGKYHQFVRKLDSEDYHSFKKVAGI